MEIARRSLFTCILLCLLLLPSLGRTERPMSDLSSNGDNASADVDLVSYLRSKAQQQDVIFTEALQLLESMKTSPSCNRIAASRLVASCHSIGGKTSAETNAYLALEHVRSLYAARLAICEINGAGASIPPPCLPVTLTPPQKKGLFGFSFKGQSTPNHADSTPTELLESCLRSLESRPQWWTSYSNSRQNAMVICQATRLETEKEELLELHRSIVESSIKLSHGLQEALRMASEESSQRKAFVEATAALQAKLAQDLEDTKNRFTATMSNFLQNIELGVDSVVSTVTSALARVQTGTATLEKDIRNATSETGYLRQILQALHDDTLAREAQVAEAHQRNTQRHNELATSLQSKLESLLQRDMARISQNVESFDSSLVWLSERLGVILQQELSISERLRDFEASLEDSESKAADLRDAQLQQLEALEAHRRLQKHMETNFQISQALLDKTTATAANLQAMIDETTARYRESPVVGSLFGPHSAWTMCGLFLSFIGAQNPRLALAALLIGTIHLTMTRFY